MRRPAGDETSRERLLAEILEHVTREIEAGREIDSERYRSMSPEIADDLDGLLATVSTLDRLGESSAGDSPWPDRGAEPLRQLGDYQIVREIGRGGMGVVYEARQIALDRRVALKVLPFAALLDERQIRRFENEARAAAQLEHRAIVPVHAVGSERGVHFYAMRYIDGQPLSVVLREIERTLGDPDQSSPTSPAAVSSAATPFGELSPGHGFRSREYFRNVARLGAEVASALQHAHESGVIHRDVKPANLLLDVNGKIWITDFGLARVSGDETLTRAGDVLGTLRYMAPEQAGDRRELVDRRTDIYSLD